MNTEFNHTEEYTFEEVALRDHLLRKTHPAPDVRQQLSLFMESKKQRQIHYTRWIVSLLSAAAVLILVFLLFRGKSQHIVVPEGAVVAYEAQKESMPHEILLKHGNEEPHAVRGKVSTPTGRTIN